MLLSRWRRLLVVGLALAGAAVGIWFAVRPGESHTAARVAPVPPFQRFHARPDLRPPPVTILRRSSGTAPGYVFLAPKRKVAQDGPMIVCNDGQVVWFDPLAASGVADFKVQRYRGRPVLTWWQGRVAKTGHGAGGGGFMIMDSSYRVIKVVHAGNGLTEDIHDLQLTARGTALMTIFHKAPYDLSKIGGPVHGYVLEGIIQEISLASGRVLFEWRSTKDVAPSESYQALEPKSGLVKAPYDYFHVNSVAVDTDDNLIVSARHTHTVYKIQRGDGAILWRLGGKKSDFTFGPGARFAWQHDARREPDGTLSVFDNNESKARSGVQSRVLVLDVNLSTHRAQLVRARAHRPPLLSTSQGNAQRLPDGHLFVGWGSKPYFTEYSADGRVLLDGRFGGAGADSYRAFRFVWVGRPTQPPAVAIEPSKNGRTMVYASWNGATQIVRWQVLAGPDAQHLHGLVTVAKDGFETAIPVRTSARYVAVRALDAHGGALGTSSALRNRS